MPTTYSAQHVLNTMYGTASTRHSEQAIANLAMGNVVTAKSFQRILNENSAQTHGTALSDQEALWTILATPLSLTGSRTRYSVQQLLNMALTANLTLATTIGAAGFVPPPPETPAQTYNGLLLAMAF